MQVHQLANGTIPSYVEHLTATITDVVNCLCELQGRLQLAQQQVSWLRTRDRSKQLEDEDVQCLKSSMQACSMVSLRAQMQGKLEILRTSASQFEQECARVVEHLATEMVQLKGEVDELLRQGRKCENKLVSSPSRSSPGRSQAFVVRAESPLEGRISPTLSSPTSTKSLAQSDRTETPTQLAKRCRHCGSTELEKDDKFCGTCGQLLEVSRQTADAVSRQSPDSPRGTDDLSLQQPRNDVCCSSAFSGISAMFRGNHPIQTSDDASNVEELGLGSRVNVTTASGEPIKGHIAALPNDSGLWGVQCLSDSSGSLTYFSPDALQPSSPLNLNVNSGVEVYHEGTWYRGHIVALPADDVGRLGRWTIKCHADPEGIFTYAEDNNIRPVALSKQEKQALLAALRKERMHAETLADVATAQLREAQRSNKKAAQFKQIVHESGLGHLYNRFLQHGLDSIDLLREIRDHDMRAMNLDSSDVVTIQAALPRLGQTQIV